MAGGGTYIERELIKSKAFLSLKGVSPILLAIILDKRRFERHGRGKNKKLILTNGDSIIFTYKEAESVYGINAKRFHRGIDELLRKGFVTIRHQGGGYKRDRSIYSLSDSWRLWKPGIVFEERKGNDVARGFCKPKKRVQQS